jgi:hypothetical protein
MTRSAAIASALAAALWSIAPASAYAQAKDLTPQQERMKSCNAQASEKSLKGDDRKQFMSSCLRGENGGTLTSQQERMRTCNVHAREKSLQGDARKEFMSSCLRGENTDLTAQQLKMRSCNRQAGEKHLSGDERKSFMRECLSA